MLTCFERINRFFLWNFILVSLCLVAARVFAAPAMIYVDQGKQWNESDRKKYYHLDQGSRMMPLKWLNALKQADGTAFMANNLARYGYLPGEGPNKDLPVGFTTNGDAVGMTCAACHTREIEVAGTGYRIDGGPAIVDFQSFVTDLDVAVEKILYDRTAFTEFVKTVLETDQPTVYQINLLHEQVSAWFLPFDTLMKTALPIDSPWGPVRLDAVSMIFNRLTGLDIGTGPDHMIPSNIRMAGAPVRYPFLWNAPIQDRTQWPGFADNGTDLLALSRNLGEVYGVFADFYPKKAPLTILGVDYLEHNSANFGGLKELENLIKKIGPPRWPWKDGKWAIDTQLAEKGKTIFDSPSKTEAGGCVACHGIRKGVTRSFQKTWATPLCNVGSDIKQYSLFEWPVDTGVLAGARIPFLKEPLEEIDNASSVLGFAVRATILQRATSLEIHNIELKAQTDIAMAEKLVGDKKLSKLKNVADKLLNQQEKLLKPELKELAGAFHKSVYKGESANPEKKWCKNEFSDPTPAVVYESRVLEGIWAAAPYLHNGSVPTLAALLEPASARPVSFKVGPSYDPDKVGLSDTQTKFDYVYQTTDCSDNMSGNSRCGHEFGTRLTPEEKAALLEYLKLL